MSDGYRELFLCDCGSPEHQMIVTAFEDEEVYICIYLKPLAFWRRIGAALAYICGRRAAFGYFEEIVLMPDAADRLANALRRK